MPSYDYKCKKCDNEFSNIRKVADRYDVECPTCDVSGETNISIMIKQATPFNYDNRMGAYRTTDTFNDRLKEMSMTSGEGHTINTR